MIPDDGKVICPNCGLGVQLTPQDFYNDYRGHVGPYVRISGVGEAVECTAWRCPACEKPVLEVNSRICVPRTGNRGSIPAGVPDHVRCDYEEACLVLDLSAKAAAALARRCLQNLLIEAGQVKAGGKLFDQIDEVAPSLPAYIRDHLHLVREAGNFAAHPAKSEATGLIVDVEPEEAEFTLEVLEQLFEHYYTQPGKAQAIRDRLNEKRQQTGKKPL